MRFAIADPPYPPEVRRRIDNRPGRNPRVSMRSRATRYYSGQSDFHPDAARWDDPDAHRELLAHLVENFDGWAIATSADAVWAYSPLPPTVKLMVWQLSNARPGAGRVASTLELVFVQTAIDRLAPGELGQVPDFMRAASTRRGFTGSKPPAWTRWVLDAMGYTPEDELVDLFPGSGSVAAAASQLAIL